MKKIPRLRTVRIAVAWCVYLALPGTAFAQEKISVHFQDTRLEQAVAQLQTMCDYYFIYNSALINPDQKVSVHKSDASLLEILDALFKGTSIRYQVDDKQVILYVGEAPPLAGADAKPAGAGAAAVATASVSDNTPPPPSAPPVAARSAPQSHVVRGTVKDETGLPLPGATILVKDTKKYVLTNMDGKFEMTDVSPNTVLQVIYLGFDTREIALDGQTVLDIVLKESSSRLEEVVVIGSIERKKESFTGAASVVSGTALKQMGTTNVVESLKSLDPSFVVLENTVAGANPNVLPTIEVRGQTSVLDIAEVDDMFRADPNQPLFILDGFETTLQKIIDLDFNRVASVTLLKDAASTAFYGSRAANGVLVVETVRGEAGRYKLFYNGDYSVQVPNLTSYNLMNAQEKLEFERLSERYILHDNRDDVINSPEEAYDQISLDKLYASRLAEVRRGVNSYWMSEPLQTALINRQSVRFSGGSKETVVDFGASYRSAPGVMKGSGRESWTGDFDFNYNKGSFSIVNRLGLSGYTSKESPYGSFQEWVNTNPYYRKSNHDAFLENFNDYTTSSSSTYAVRVSNPLYNALLNSKNQTSNLHIDERLQARWQFYKGMRLEGMFQLSTANTNTIRFTPPENTAYYDVIPEQRGAYYEGLQKSLSYVANIMYVWANNIGKHNYIVNARGEIAHSNTSSVNFSATGFPYGTNGAPSFASNYVDGRPGYGNSIYRRANFLASLNYSFDNRYLFDATFRMDGSTVFGSAKKFSPFWSAGIGWNVHEERFLENAHWLTQFRLRATMGQTGNQNLGTVLSTSVYGYLSGSNVFGTGLSLSQLGNPYVEWQKTTTTNLALDLNLFNSRFVGKFEVFQKYTNPLSVLVDQAPSTGVYRYPMSLGHLTYRGFEFDATTTLIRNTAKSITWRMKLMGSILRGEYGGLSNMLETLNKTARESNALNRYMDGYGPKTLWAVRSLGIDPATGREVFLDKDNQPTFTYNANDITHVGIGEPDLSGTITSFFTYKQVSVTVSLRYSLGSQIFNYALYNKVENISFRQLAYNQDRRALYDRWQNPGDIAQFKAISVTSSTPISSRFIQTENYLSGESVGVMWRFDKNTWIRRLGMERLDLNATASGTGGIFRISNIKRERGTAYPEASLVSLSVSAVF